jgi:hypothetical protein
VIVESASLYTTGVDGDSIATQRGDRQRKDPSDSSGFQDREAARSWMQRIATGNAANSLHTRAVKRNGRIFKGKSATL